jgi:hypothetical protein
MSYTDYIVGEIGMGITLIIMGVVFICIGTYTLITIII